MSIIHGVVSVTGTLSAATCYRERTGRCSLDLIGDFSLRPDVVLPENDLLFCPRLRELLAVSDIPVSVTACDCGHVQAAFPQCVCVAAKLGQELPLVAEAAAAPACVLCQQKRDARHWDVKAAVHKG